MSLVESLEVKLRTPPTDTELRHVARFMRTADAVEVFRSSGEGPLRALQDSVKASSMTGLFYWKGEAIAVAGVAPLCSGIGAPWLLGTDQVHALSPRQITRIGRAFVAAWSEDYPLLTNYVDVENTVSRRWLKAVGFVEREYSLQYGHSRAPFVRFEMVTHPELPSTIH